MVGRAAPPARRQKRERLLRRARRNDEAVLVLRPYPLAQPRHRRLSQADKLFTSLARGSSFLGAGFPVGWGFGVGQGVDDLEGVSFAGGGTWPRGLVVVFEAHVRLAKRVLDTVMTTMPRCSRSAPGWCCCGTSLSWQSCRCPSRSRWRLTLTTALLPT